MRVFDGEAVDLSQANAACRHARGKGQKGPTAMIQEPSQPASLVSTRRRIVGLTMSDWLGPRSVNSGAGGKGLRRALPLLVTTARLCECFWKAQEILLMASSKHWPSGAPTETPALGAGRTGRQWLMLVQHTILYGAHCMQYG